MNYRVIDKETYYRKGRMIVIWTNKDKKSREGK